MSLQRIRDEFAKNLPKHGLAGDMVLIDSTPGTRNPAALIDGTNPTTNEHSCSGMVKSFETGQIDGTLVLTDDRDIGILGGTLTEGIVPEPGDSIVIASGDNAGTWIIVGGRDGKGVRSDPASAVYWCHGRKV